MNMKLWALPLALSIVTSGCSDLLLEEPESFVTTDTYYRTASDLENAVISAYEPLKEPDLFVRFTLWTLELPSDHARINPAEPNVATSHPDVLGWDASSQYAIRAWRPLYRINQRAALVIERSTNVEMEESHRAQLVAEAKFLRALAYWYLVRIYGDVPLLLTEQEILRQDVPRTAAAEVVAQILQDARDAEAGLPSTWTGNDRGRATRGAALALQTDVHIWNNDWQQAAVTAKRIIDSNSYSLFSDYLQAFLPANKNGQEHVFSVQATGVEQRTSTAFPQSYFPRELGFDQGGGYGVVQPTLEFLDSYPTGDYRRQVSYRTEGCSVSPSIGCVTFYPMVWKYRPSNGGIPQVRGDVDIPVYRYAEVLLWYAEAQNELGDAAEAARYLNLVRARARNGAGNESRVEPADIPVLARDEMREAIFDERGWELAFEMKRWFDLVRRGPDYAFKMLRQNDPNPNRAPFEQPTRLLHPIPQYEIDNNSALTQNPGY